MSMNLATTQKHFRKMAKMVFAYQSVDAPIASIEKTVAGLLAQDADADSTQFLAITKVLAPFATKMNSRVNSITGVQTDCVASVKSYLQQIVAVDLGLAAGTTLTTVNTALVSQMTSASASVAPSGNGGSNADGICLWFKDNIGVTLPQNASPNIPDSYIDDDTV